MNNKHKFLVVFSVCFVLFADLYAQKPAHITADIAGLNTGTVTFSYELNDAVYKDSVRADHGMISKDIRIPESVLCTLSNSINQQIRIFLLDQSSIQISGALSRFYELKVSGAGENDLLTQYKASLYSFPGTRPKPTGNTENDKRTRSVFAARQGLFRDSVLARFVAAYPAHVASAIAVYELYVTYPDRDKADQGYKTLSPAVQQSNYGKMIKTFIDASINTDPGALAANFSLADKNGRLCSLAAFKGKYVLIDFWASWCVPCRKENPNLIKAYQAYQNKGFTIVGLSMDSSKENWLTAVDQDKLPWLQLNDPKSTTGKVANIYGVKSLPANFLVGPDGKIIAKNLRGEAVQKKLKALIH
ncbi:Peroxiredoxin [Pedobacter westerhofensis]|uniref:Peroxiredoxin n=1 Tax=Pedobacter westerhofensis TaxID=425512 RepID=A0A521AX96_9SPHI|nr:TlpA disulfide reductase family protein [Pedobacter westerhofensis]SMO39482.1 Peroxiredoxin [Pedobacter westerhofensis]